MNIFLALVLLFLMIIIGGERGAVSIMALAGNIIILFFSIIRSDGGCGLRCTSYGSFAECNDSSRYCNTGTDVF